MRTGVPQECGIESPERLRDDGCALSELQHACSKRLCATVQQEQEAYVINHPETLAGMTLIVAEMIKLGTRKDILTHVASYFMQPIQELDLKIRQLLKSPSRGSYLPKDRQTFDYVDHFLAYDIKRIMDELFPSKLPDIPTLPSSISNTTSSSFISIISSASTPKTPEKVPTPEPTWEQVIHGMVSGAVEKAMLAKVTDAHILYDAAYVELSKAVELAMEVPVIEIREDIAELYNGAYKQFEVIVEEIERIAAEILWEKRMRKKYKRTWRRQINFRGYLSPPTPKSYVSSHASYKVPPQPPCECQPQWTFNRYPKDRFGIYLPRDEEFDSNNVTSTPLMSNANLTDAEE